MYFAMLYVRIPFCPLLAKRADPEVKEREWKGEEGKGKEDRQM